MDWTAERFRRIEEVFAAAADRPPEERGTWLVAVCGDDLELLREVESLLAHDVDSTLLMEPLVREAAKAVAGPATPAPLGRRIGPYRVTGIIGSGGMGAVYLAVRDDEQYRKQVAIKVVRQGMVTAALLDRFRRERQILAGLEHPNIARLLEGGTTGEGLPYFALEYVQGMPITDYCRTLQLSIEDRVRLFREVCGAVHYAHQNLVVHLDLKPSNVLVAADGTPKLLDFGIARFLDTERGERSAPTLTAGNLLTPDYASPEQVSGAPVTTATDVYSLGAVLYELLTQRRPHRFRDLSIAEIERVVCHEEIERPSVASRRESSLPPRWRHRLAGDLDTIAAKALRKEPWRRYASAEQLSEDLRRYLEGLPVQARAESAAYRAGKFVRRNKLAVTAALLVLLSLAGGLAATAHQARIARQRFEELRRLAHTFLFDFHDAIRDLPGSTAAREMVATTALEYLDRLGRSAAGDRALQLELAQAYQRVGDVQGNIRLASLGRLEDGLASHRKALRLAEELAVRDPGDLAALRLLSSCHQKIGDLELQSGDLEGGVASLRRGLEAAEEASRRGGGAFDDLMLLIRARESLGDAQLRTRDLSGALESYRTTLTLCRRRAARFPEPQGMHLHGLSLAHARLGDALAESGSLEATLEAYAEALRIRLELVDAYPSNPRYRRELKTTYTWLGNFSGHPHFLNRGDSAAALGYYREALALAEQEAAADPVNALARYDLAVALAKVADMLAQRDPAASADHYRRALEAFDPLLEANPEDFKYRRRQALYLRSLAAPLRRLGDAGGALETLRRSLAILRRLESERPGNGEVRADLHAALLALGDLHLETGDLPPSLASYRQALALTEGQPAGHGRDLYALWRRAESCSRMGRYHRAEAAAAAAAADREESWRRAEPWFAEALEVWEEWPRHAVSGPFDRQRREAARRELERCRREGRRPAAPLSH